MSQQNLLNKILNKIPLFKNDINYAFYFRNKDDIVKIFDENADIDALELIIDFIPKKNTVISCICVEHSLCGIDTGYYKITSNNCAKLEHSCDI